MRERIWYSLADTKVNEFYTAEVVKLYQKINWILNIFLVITTSGSVAAWALWDMYPILWIIIFSASQLIVLIKPFLFSSKYIRSYNEKNIRLQNLALELENLWYKYENGRINDKEAEEIFSKLRQKEIDISNFGDDLIVLKHKKCLSLAEKRASNELKRF